MKRRSPTPDRLPCSSASSTLPESSMTQFPQQQISPHGRAAEPRGSLDLRSCGRRQAGLIVLLGRSWRDHFIRARRGCCRTGTRVAEERCRAPVPASCPATDDLIAPDRTADLLRRADMIVLPEKCVSESGVAAAAFGCPCPMVASRAGGLPEFIRARLRRSACPHHHTRDAQSRVRRFAGGGHSPRTT
jgi:hypothetical protein